jgi:hypothetical protein
VTPADVGEKKEYLIPRGKHISVYEGDYVRRPVNPWSAALLCLRIF